MAESSLPPDVVDLALRSHLIGGMAIVNHVLSRLDLDTALERAVPHDDARLRFAPAKALGVVVRNLVVRHMVRTFGFDVTQLHNDSNSITDEPRPRTSMTRRQLVAS